MKNVVFAHGFKAVRFSVLPFLLEKFNSLLPIDLLY